MRETKFRVWDKERCDWVSSNVCLDYSGLLFWCFAGSMKIIDDPERYDVQFFTGLKDKNGTKSGKEIYEGDIVIFENKNYRVIWNKHEASFDFSLGSTHDAYNGRIADCVEIIGNIYENKELL